MQKSSSIAEVMEMKQENFHDHRSYLRNIYTERNKDEERAPLQFSKAVWFNFGIGEELVGGVLQKKEHKNEVWLRYTHDITEVPRKVSFYKKSGVSFTVHAPAPLYSKYPLPIKAAKATDLQRLSMYVPHTLRCMYIGLPTVEDECESE